jgi:hypothetical protein
VTLPFAFQSLVSAFNTAGAADITFLRWSGNVQVIGGIAIDDGYEALVLSPQWAFVPNAPKDLLAQLPDGDRQRSSCLVWSVAVDAAGTAYDTLQTVDQSTHHRPDRIVDNDRGLTYVVTIAWTYGRQSRIAGAIGLLLDE